MKKIRLVTTQRETVELVQNVFDAYKITVIPIDIALPEAAYENIAHCATAQARAGYKKTKKPVIAITSGLYINALRGFPKTLVTFALKTIGSTGILKLLKGKPRNCSIKICLGYYDGRGFPLVFERKAIEGALAKKPKGKRKKGDWADILRLFTPKHATRSVAEMTQSEFRSWIRETYQESYLMKFAEWFPNHH